MADFWDRNPAAYHAALVQKQFVLNFMTSYMSMFFTSFVYIPFGHILTPFLNFWGKAAQTVSFSQGTLKTRQFHSNPQRIANQMYYTTVTAQIINFTTEVIVPFVKRKVFAKAEQLVQSSGKDQSKDHPEEAEFLQRVREEAELEHYDVTGDYREMVMQFGKLSSRPTVTAHNCCSLANTSQAICLFSPSRGR